MKIIAFLLANWDSVLVVLAFLALIVVLIKRGETAVLNRILFGLVTKAEKEFGGGTGKLKLAAVSDWIYQRIPAVLKRCNVRRRLVCVSRWKPCCPFRRK